MNKCLFPFLFAALLWAATPTLAATNAKPQQGMKEKSLGAFGNWNAYSYDQGGQTVCYMVTTRLVNSSGVPKRSGPYLMITHRPVEASTDVFSYNAGMLMNAKRGVYVTIGKATFDLFAVRDTAWARDGQTDHKIAAAIRANMRLAAKAYPDKKKAKPINDMFDLSGASAAYHAIGKACGLPDDSQPASLVKKKPSVQKTN